MEEKKWSRLDEEYLEKLELRKDELYAIEHPSQLDLVEIAQITIETLRLRDLREGATGSRV